jgi:hypothetical protein
MFECRLCGLQIEAIPDDAIQIGNVYRFSKGEFHFLRKKLAPRTGPRFRRNKLSAASNVTPIAEATLEVALMVPATVVPANESTIQRAFRLRKVA